MIKIGGYVFEGWFHLFTNTFNDVAGIYVISGPNGLILDVGETNQLATRMANHERKPLWVMSAGKHVYLAFLSVLDSKQRLDIEKYLRNLLKPLHGEK